MAGLGNEKLILHVRQRRAPPLFLLLANVDRKKKKKKKKIIWEAKTMTQNARFKWLVVTSEHQSGRHANPICSVLFHFNIFVSMKQWLIYR